MRPGDLRQTVPAEHGECYLCRHIFRLEDLMPVPSASSTDWRWICPLCRQVAKRTRGSWQSRAIAAEKLNELSRRDQQHP